MEEKKYYTLHNTIYDETVTVKLSNKEYIFLTWFINEVTRTEDELWLEPIEKVFEFKG
jgi:hypothetical protein